MTFKHIICRFKYVCNILSLCRNGSVKEIINTIALDVWFLFSNQQPINILKKITL